MTEDLQVENDKIVAAVKELLNGDPYVRLTMLASNNSPFRGLHIHCGLGQDHYVNENIRDPQVLAEIVKGFQAGQRIGREDGVKEIRSNMLSILGVSVEDNKIIHVDA